MPSGIKKNKSTNPPINGIKLINKKNPDLFVSCNLLTPAEIAGIKVNNLFLKKNNQFHFLELLKLSMKVKQLIETTNIQIY